MKVTTLEILLIACLAFAACEKAPTITLYGILGEKFESQFVLTQTGDQFEGYFIYTEKPSEKIPVRGTKIGETLRLEEYNNDENKLTGIFSGTYKVGQYKGSWKDPAGKSKVPFEYSLLEKEALHENPTQKEVIKIDYALYGKNKRFAYHHGLKGTVNGEERIIIEAEEDSGTCITAIEVRDFDGDGINDALLSYATTCAGNGWPVDMLNFYTYLPALDKFIQTDEFGSIIERPIIQQEKNGYSVNITSIHPYAMYRAYGKYTLRDGKVVELEYKEVSPLPALAEILAEDFTEYEQMHGKTLKFDLNGDGKFEIIKAEYWARWRMLGWDIQFPSGQKFQGEHSCFRIGVLSSKTRGYHDLVSGLDEVLIWDGGKYVVKE